MMVYPRTLAFALAVAAIFLAPLAGCGGEVPIGNGPAEFGTATGSAKLFSLGALPQFHIYLDDETVEAFNSDDDAVLKTYRPATFRYRDLVWEYVGVRLKGNLSLTRLDAKPSFKIKFNKFIKGRRFLGLEALTLNNMFSDPSMLREYVAYKVFRELGVPAARAGYAELFVNDEPYGLYLDLESMDDVFLHHNFKDASGDLYEGEHGDDLDRDIWNYEHDEGEDTMRVHLQELADLATDDAYDLFYANDTPLDTPRVLDFVAAETFVGHFDGYWTSHNYFIYHEPTLNRWTWSPWSLDQTLIRKTNPFRSKGYLARKCRNRPDCLVDYIGRGIMLADTVSTMGLHDEIDRVLDLIDYASHNDTRKRHDNDAMVSSQARTTTWIRNRPDSFRETLDCLVDGAEPDTDGDGFGSCFSDCDDTDASVQPDAEEVCDGIDNDCSGFADDIPECPCRIELVMGREFHFCTHKFGWSKARRFCDDQGLELARFDNREQNDAVWAIAREIDSGRWAFGLSDRQEEADYRWIDGSAPSFFAWDSGEPANMLAWFDCVFFKGSNSALWRESNCSTTAPFLCSEIK
ncbi:MAG: CotH kinase family protein [Nannocystaceae bacterium]